MATTTGCCLTSSSSSSSSSLLHNNKTKISIPIIPKRIVSFSLRNFHCPKLSSLHWTVNNKKARFCTVLAVVDEEAVVVEDEINVEKNSNDVGTIQDSKNFARPCELYVCNLPRSCDIPELLEMFKPFGTVISVEVSRNPETGISRGCGYVTMGSINSARNALVALDGSDVGGREMRIRYAVDMTSNKTGNTEALTSTPKKVFVYESPHKLFVGNLAWSVKPEDLRNHFSRFGTVVSARVLHDRKGRSNRVFGFLSFSSAAERNAAFALDGTEFCSRKLIVREGVERTES